MKAIQNQDIAGTSLQGYVETTRADLQAAFGEPIFYEPGDKVTIEWSLQFEDGTIATIYDWKRYEDDAPELHEKMTYNIGGISAEAVARVKESLLELGLKVTN
jgi:hypothetical protein